MVCLKLIVFIISAIVAVDSAVDNKVIAQIGGHDIVGIVVISCCTFIHQSFKLISIRSKLSAIANEIDWSPSIILQII
jgi:hypothetical protein